MSLPLQSDLTIEDLDMPPSTSHLHDAAQWLNAFPADSHKFQQDGRIEQPSRLQQPSNARALLPPVSSNEA
ncbi:hypothetical protein BKA56DRAFT_44769 [Ilyonectria sp. MPI-CAGE-AT-0026]|nr:hypothetical protein BKA56DRAFT_44769 [Ilyonectria sp. MPI-CAGE-AT-0026]